MRVSRLKSWEDPGTVMLELDDEFRLVLRAVIEIASSEGLPLANRMSPAPNFEEAETALNKLHYLLGRKYEQADEPPM